MCPLSNRIQSSTCHSTDPTLALHVLWGEGFMATLSLEESLFSLPSLLPITLHLGTEGFESVVSEWDDSWEYPLLNSWAAFHSLAITPGPPLPHTQITKYQHFCHFSVTQTLHKISSLSPLWSLIIDHPFEWLLRFANVHLDQEGYHMLGTFKEQIKNLNAEVCILIPVKCLSWV